MRRVEEVDLKGRRGMVKKTDEELFKALGLVVIQASEGFNLFHAEMGVKTHLDWFDKSPTVEEALEVLEKAKAREIESTGTEAYETELLVGKKMAYLLSTLLENLGLASFWYDTVVVVLSPVPEVAPVVVKVKPGHEAHEYLIWTKPCTPEEDLEDSEEGGAERFSLEDVVEYLVENISSAEKKT